MTKSPQDHPWIIAEVRASNRAGGVFRYIQDKPADWQTLPLSEEISISWRYEGDFPESEVKASMDQMEDALWPLASGERSCLALVMTVGGLREWVFYSQSYTEFMSLLNECLAGSPRYPISIQHSPDPEWRYWHSFVDKIASHEN
jgi:hypothetical protein